MGPGVTFGSHSALFACAPLALQHLIPTCAMPHRGRKNQVGAKNFTAVETECEFSSLPARQSGWSVDTLKF